MVEEIKADSIEEYVEKYIDAEIDQPRYTSMMKILKLLRLDHQSRSSSNDTPGTKVDIDALEDWVRTKNQSPRDPVLQKTAGKIRCLKVFR